jgi:hypothetical protein
MEELEIFCQFYFPFIENYPQLFLEHDKIVDRYSFVSSIDCDFIQNFSEEVFQNPSLALHFGMLPYWLLVRCSHLDVLDEKIELLSRAERSARLREFAVLYVHDLLIATSLVPTKARSFPRMQYRCLR